MKIKSVELNLPERLITNDHIADRIEFHSKRTLSGDARKLARCVVKLLDRSGADTRYWSDKRDKPIHYIADAIERAVTRSGICKGDIELVIYAGVDRGFYEPANAYFLADYLGLRTAQCFDVVDACNGWSRALQICDAFFQVGMHRCALIVNGEFPMFEGGAVNPKLFQFQSFEQLRHRFAAFTLGEGAVATIVTSEEDPAWEYHSLSDPAHADLCTVSCHDNARYSRSSSRLNLDGARTFVSFGEEMLGAGFDKAVEVLRRLSKPLDAVSAIFPHTVSQYAVDAAASRAGVSNLVYSIFPRTGNLISASIPASIAFALKEERVKQGNVAAGWVGSAGMVFSAYTFTI